ncbi:elongation of very long chain fatty acids protein 6 [Calypte anna]|nr:elongation of very long chain fatty acids protein 6 [Calypte anna]
MLAMELSLDPSELELRGEFGFERDFNDREAREWMRENWHKSVVLAVVYVILVFGIQQFMKGRRAYSLRTPLALWSLGLALLNGIAARRVWQHLSFILATKGFRHSVCSQSFYIHPISKLWVYLFALSKLLELGDTLFIVLRKKQLIFLHWFHHVTSLVATWYGYKEMVAGTGWLTVLNFSVHAIMYSYYVLRAAGFQVSRPVAMAITVTQILQMLGFVVMYALILFWMEEEDKVCHTSWAFGFLSFVLCLSFLVLFCNLFLKTYLGSTQKPKRR